MTDEQGPAPGQPTGVEARAERDAYVAQQMVVHHHYSRKDKRVPGAWARAVLTKRRYRIGVAVVAGVGLIAGLPFLARWRIGGVGPKQSPTGPVVLAYSRKQLVVQVSNSTCGHGPRIDVDVPVVVADYAPGTDFGFDASCGRESGHR